MLSHLRARGSGGSDRIHSIPAMVTATETRKRPWTPRRVEVADALGFAVIPNERAKRRILTGPPVRRSVYSPRASDACGVPPAPAPPPSPSSHPLLTLYELSVNSRTSGCANELR